MTVSEPATLLTDYLLAVLAGWLGWRLHRSRPATNRAAHWWSRALWLTALSAFTGGSYHGFAPNFPTAVAAIWWMITLLILSLVSAAMAMSLLHELAPVESLRLWRALIGCKLAVFASAAIGHPVFVVAILDYGMSMLAWAGAAVLVRRAWSGWMLAAIALSIVAALVQQIHWSPSPHFNHNDLYHVIQALAICGFYRAGTRFGTAGRRDAAVPSTPFRR